MKSRAWLFLVIVLCASSVPALSQESNVADTNNEIDRGVPWTEFDFISPEHVQMMLYGIRRIAPQKAGRLERLYETNFEAFKKESTEFMREHRDELFPGWGKSDDKEPGKGPHNRMWQEQMKEMQKRNEEYLNWLKQNYPAEANELEQARKDDPGLYMRRLMKSGRKYGAVAAAAKTNPQLAEVLKKDIELKDRRDEILKKLEIAQTDEKDVLVAQLKDVVAARFDVIIQRQQMQHQELLERLKKLEKRVKDSEQEVEKWKASKDKEVEARVKKLLEGAEEFKWD
ncbi:MAG: hypothetical protein WC962_09485 [Phycisphaerae bacterium]|jgi:hypothetical protein